MLINHILHIRKFSILSYRCKGHLHVQLELYIPSGNSLLVYPRNNIRRLQQITSNIADQVSGRANFFDTAVKGTLSPVGSVKKLKDMISSDSFFV